MIPIRGSVRGLRAPVVTWALLALNVMGFLQELALPPDLLSRFIELYGLVPARYLAALQDTPGDVSSWGVPLLTSMFLHGGWAHLIGNMFFLWVFGEGVEALLGRVRFLVFYLVVGVAAAHAQVAASPESLIPMVGASGAIAGVLGAYLLAFPRASVTLMVPIVIIPVLFDVPALLFLGIWFIEQLYAGTLGQLSGAADAGGVAWWAHVGGFVAGVVALPLVRRPLRTSYGSRRRLPARRVW